MIQQQVYILTNILMLIDGIMVILAGYTAYYVNFLYLGQTWSMPTDIFVASVMVVMFVNNYALGKRGLYDDRKPPSFLKLNFDIGTTIIINFSVLSVLIFILKQHDYSRTFFLFFALICFLYMALERLIFQQYFNQISSKSANNRKILI